jgi:recombination protein RecR
MIRRRALLLDPLAAALSEVAETVRECDRCGNVATAAVCAICADPRRAAGTLCVVETVADLWAMERAGAFRGRYHVLGGVLSALDGVGPDTLRVPQLLQRVGEEGIDEVILALNATVDGQTTAHYLAETLEPAGIAVTSLAQGVPIGGELDYLDDGTIGAALAARKPV